ncbi:MAG: DsrE family protein [Gillisia sp.]
MKKIWLLVFSFCLTGFAMQSQTINPVIKDFGGMLEVPLAVAKPDPSINYKIALEIGEKITNGKEVNPEIEAIARLYNLLSYSGVPQDHIHIAVIIYHSATWIILNDEEYHKKFGVDNPNTKAFEEMADAGIEFFVCGQTFTVANLKPEQINPHVKIALSRLTRLSTLEMQGYVNFKI